jgi:hypothetical protein
LTQNFIDEEPLAKSYYKQFPEQRAGAYEYWGKYWDMYMDEAIISGISLVIVDVEKEEVVGVYILKDFRYVP